MIDALGMIEVIGFVPAVAAADSAVKSANVRILKLYKVDGGIVTLAVTGDVGAVRAAVEAGTETARALGTVRSTHVIARLQPQLEKLLLPEEAPVKRDIKLKIAAFMQDIPMPKLPEAADAEGVPQAASPLELAAAITPFEDTTKPAAKKPRRKKTPEEPKQ